jgi:hypothetical protein
LNGQEIYEVEVKVSLSDLKREPMKVKHKITEVQTCFKPCKYFYLAVPEYLKEQALEICKKNFPNAGLYILRDGHYSGSYGASGVDTIIQAKPITIPNLHKYQDLQDRAIRGMANNLAKLYSDLVEAKKQLTPLKLV